MPDDYKLSILTNDKLADLTILYLQNQNLTSMTPEMILDKYDEAFYRIKRHYEDTRSDRRHVEPQ